jgi:peroxiredoxin
MPVLSPPARAPEFELPAVGGPRLALAAMLRRGPVVAVFFKDSCPTCQFTLPFLERLYRAYPREKVAFAGISQDSPERTAAFLREYGITFPVLLDDTRTYPVANAYGVQYVPTILLIAPGGGIEFTSEGWMRKEMEDLNARLARATGAPPAPLFLPGEKVPDFKGG